MSFQPVDRMPVVEPFKWWNLTLDRWRSEGLPANANPTDFFNLDPHHQVWLGPGPDKNPEREDGDWDINSFDDYERAKKHLFPRLAFDPDDVDAACVKQGRGEIFAWITVEGFFWFPRVLFGIEKHLYAFYDHPDLMHAINRDVLEFNKRQISGYCRHLVPDWMTVAEDMSFNSGSMIGRELVDEFMRPYYRELVSHVRNCGIRFIFMDTDGDCSDNIDWFHGGMDIDGFVPFERNAGMDLSVTRKRHPRLLVIGGFNKRKMFAAEAEMVAEFEQALPVLKTGGVILGCDHQTPPQVSLEQYGRYVKLLREYAALAAG
jgi:hypothetical protein